MAGGVGGFGRGSGAQGFGGSSGVGRFGGSIETGVITRPEATKWKNDVQYAFNKPEQVAVLRGWIGFRQIDLSGAEQIIDSTDQSNEIEVARILIEQCTADRAQIKSQFRIHMQMDNWTAVFGK